MATLSELREIMRTFAQLHNFTTVRRNVRPTAKYPKVDYAVRYSCHRGGKAKVKVADENGIDPANTRYT